MISANLKYLRKSKAKSQEEVANDISIKRTTLSGYENGSAEPNTDYLLRLSDYYGITVDALLRQDLSKTGIPAADFISQVSGASLRIIATTVDRDNNDNIELVPLKARAGYTSGYADPEYIRVLPAFNMPFLSPGKKYRTFPIIGDSMPPVADGSWVTGEYLENWNFIKNGNPYIIVTKDDGIVFKSVYNQIDDEGTLLLCSTNPAYEPYEIAIHQVLEVWKFTHYISSELPEPNLDRSEIASTVMHLQREVNKLKNTMRKA
jgi:transcriptional regulator with XRE-family HTH domain